MTSAQFMPSGAGRRVAAAALACSVVTGWVVAGGCAKRLTPPVVLARTTHLDQFQGQATRRRQLWAVAPFANESGVSTVDTHRIADLFTQELQGVVGIDTIPVNRVIFAMRHIGMTAVTSPAEARQLARALGADAIVVGTVTVYDPYPPPTLGAAVQLFATDPRGSAIDLDPKELTRAARDPFTAAGPVGPDMAIAQAAGVFDASNHQTLAWLGSYAAGRTEPDAPFGPDIYLMNMKLYTQFVSFRLIHDLLHDEWARQAPLANDASPR